MLSGSPSNKNTLTPRGILAGALVAPLLTIMSTGGQGVNVCTGIFALCTLLFWYLAYLHIAEFIRSVNWGGSRQQTFTPLDRPSLPAAPPASPEDDSRSIFL